jgi:hypothetical protein
LQLNHLHFSAERKKKAQAEAEQPHRLRHGHVLWNALKIALGIFIAVKLFQCITRRRRRGGAAKAGTYSKIEEGQDGPSGSNNSNNNQGYGSAAAPYGEGGVGYVPAGKFEPLGYTGAVDVPGSAGLLAPSPMNSPDPGKETPTFAMSLNAPPPYTAQEGTAVEYFSQQPLQSPALYSPEPSPGPTAVTFPAAAQEPRVVPTHNPYSMSATYTPGQS